MDVRAAILPLCYNLCKRENLSKCLLGRTYNANESFNGMIWNRLPKANHVGTDGLGVYDVIAQINDGAVASLEIFKDMNMEPGDHMMRGLQILA